MNKQHVVQLDALRGMAALIVVVSHGANSGLLPGALGQGFGQMGVGIFYILSAFLLTTIYVSRDLTRNRAFDYLIRRGARVLPLFYIVLIGSLVGEWLSGVSLYKAFNTPRALIENILLIKGSSVLWSIPVEIQFYLIFLGFWRLISFGLPLAFGFLIVVQGIFLLLDSGTSLTTFDLPYYMHIFTIGCAFGLMAQQPGLSERIAGSALFRALVLVVVATTILALPGVRRVYLGLEPWAIYADPVNLVWITTISAACIFGLVRHHWVDKKIFRFMGEVSFSVYLLHMIFIIAVKKFSSEDLIFPYDRFVIVIIGTYALAALVTHNIERPAQKAILRAVLPRALKQPAVNIGSLSR